MPLQNFENQEPFQDFNYDPFNIGLNKINPKPLNLTLTKQQKLITQKIYQNLTAYPRPNQAPNILLIGEPGTGKNTIVETLINQLDDVFVIHPSHLKQITQNSTDNLINHVLSTFEPSISAIILDNRPNVFNSHDAALKDMLKVLFLSKKISPIITTATPQDAKIMLEDPEMKANLQTFYLKPASPSEMQPILTDLQLSPSNQDYLLNHVDLINAAKKMPGSLMTILNQIQDPKNITLNQIKDIFYNKSNTPELKYQPQLAQQLSQNLIGQDQAIQESAQAINTGILKLIHPNKPIANLLFYGPSGTGKTYLAQQIAQNIFGSKQNIIKINGGEFQDRTDISRILGASAGLIGSDSNQELQMTDQLLVNPFNVVLIDEVDKLHPDILRIFLSAMDDGFYKDAKNRKINTQYAIFIFTANTGSKELTQNNLGFSQSELTKKDQQRILGQTFTPELLNRFSKIIDFKPLNLKDLEQILDLQLTQLQQSLKDRFDYDFHYNLADYQAELQKRQDPHENGRMIERLIQDEVLPQIQTDLLTSQNK